MLRVTCPRLKTFALWGGGALILVVLWEVFETMILPRAVMRRGRITHLFYRATDWAKRGIVGRVTWRHFRETLLAAYGPISLLSLVILWSTLIIVGFALLHYGHFTQFKEGSEAETFGNYLYFSGTTFFTLGYGDLTPLGAWGRTMAVAEAGIGFGLLASVIGYLPVLYQAFSTRETALVRLANRCGGTVDGVGLVERFARRDNYLGLEETLENLEEWTAELLETTVSYPVIAFYRSQREERSWIGGLVAVLDATTLIQLDTETPWPPRLVDQAVLTFTMAHRSLQALSKALHVDPIPSDRRAYDHDALRERLSAAGIVLETIADERWEALVGRYEPEAICLSEYLSLRIPSWPSAPPETGR